MEIACFFIDVARTRFRLDGLNSKSQGVNTVSIRLRWQKNDSTAQSCALKRPLFAYEKMNIDDNSPVLFRRERLNALSLVKRDWCSLQRQGA